MITSSIHVLSILNLTLWKKFVCFFCEFRNSLGQSFKFLNNIFWLSFSCTAGVHRPCRGPDIKKCRLSNQLISLSPSPRLCHGQPKQIDVTVSPKITCHLQKQVTGKIWSMGHSLLTPNVQHCAKSYLRDNVMKVTLCLLKCCLVGYD